MQYKRQILSKHSMPTVLFLTLLMMNLPAFGQTPKWFEKILKIKLFETTRNDIEKLFDNPKISNSQIGAVGISVDYKLKVGELSITYSFGQCSENNIYDYAVAAHVVTNVEVYLSKPVAISQLGLNMKQFDKVEVGDVEGLFNYSSKAKGIYFIGDDRNLHEIEFTLTAEQEKLSCQNIKGRLN